MTLIIGIFFRDENDNKEIIFASDGLVTKYENNRMIGQDENIEKIKKISSNICMGYAGKNGELFLDIYNELKNNISNKAKKKLYLFTKRLQKLLLKFLNTQKHKRIEEELKKRNQLYQKFIVGGLFHNKITLITANPEDNYKLKIKDPIPISPDYAIYVAGMNSEIQEEVWAILEKKIKEKGGFEEIKEILKSTISEIAERYPESLNKRIFIRKLSNKFDLEK